LCTRHLNKGLALCIGNHYHDFVGQKLNLCTAANTLAGWSEHTLGLRSSTLIDVPGDDILLKAIEHEIAVHVEDNDDGLMLFYNGHADGHFVYGEDMRPTSYADILKTVDCEKLAGKPKIVVLDCCQGENLTQVVLRKQEPRPFVAVAKARDLIVAKPCADGTCSWGDAEGGIYSQKLMSVFSAFHQAHHLMDLFLMLNSQVKEAAHFDVSCTYKIMLGTTSEPVPQAVLDASAKAEITFRSESATEDITVTVSDLLLAKIPPGTQKTFVLKMAGKKGLTPEVNGQRVAEILRPGASYVVGWNGRKYFCKPERGMRAGTSASGAAVGDRLQEQEQERWAVADQSWL